MSTVTVAQTIDAPPEAIEAVIESDLTGFMRAGEFDDVTVDGDHVRLTKRVGIATMKLTVRVVSDEDAVLAYEAVDGIFESMRTTVTVRPLDDGDQSEVTGHTTFSIDIDLVGMLLEATVVKRQRRREMRSQFDWLARQIAD